MTDVILVDRHDRVIGRKEKLQAHQDGDLHRAYSIFVFNSNHQLLLQRRAEDKYHARGLWSNTCCSHPVTESELLPQAQQRLLEEMGFSCPLQDVGSLIYKVDLEDGLIEHELDHLLVGLWDGEPVINLNEVSDFLWYSESDLHNDLRDRPSHFTPWFRIIAKDPQFQWK
ncbi:MAG: isopentenyl-diphosphate Delta-isomerase [SAR324 cluster bacterium]|nr:isopentenyl-diphosphate Delta-isomerase [SAR324 cluster bacterium]